MKKLSTGPIGAMLECAIPDGTVTTSNGGNGVLIAAAEIAQFLNDCKGAIWVLGNGGSAASAMHICADLRNLQRRARTVTDLISLTGLSNDHGYEHALSRVVVSDADHRDSILLLSVSGSSRNLVELADIAKNDHRQVMSIVGKGGVGELTRRGGPWVAVNSHDYPFVEYVHFGLVAAAIEMAL